MNNGLYNGLEGDLTDGLYSGLLENPYPIFNGIDPILLGQPALYLQSFNSSFLTMSGNTITAVRRFRDSGLNTNTLATSELIKSNVHNRNWIEWNNTAVTAANAKWTIGANTSFAFVHQRSNVSTHYYVVSTIANDDFVDGSGANYMLSTATTGQLVGFSIYITANSDGTRQFFFRLRNGASQVFNVQLTPAFGKIDMGPILISIRMKDPNIVGSLVAMTYLNGKQYSLCFSAALLSTSATSSSVLNVGNRSSNDGVFRGRIGEAIIFNAYHDDGTHKQVCNNLMKKWGINKSFM